MLPEQLSVRTFIFVLKKFPVTVLFFCLEKKNNPSFTDFNSSDWLRGSGKDMLREKGKKNFIIKITGSNYRVYLFVLSQLCKRRNYQK